jgi:hypothetical protein
VPWCADGSQQQATTNLAGLAHLDKLILCFFTPNIFWILDTFDHILITLAGDAGNNCLPRRPLLLLMLRPVTTLAEAAPQACTAIRTVLQVSFYTSCHTRQAFQKDTKQLVCLNCGAAAGVGTPSLSWTHQVLS